MAGKRTHEAYDLTFLDPEMPERPVGVMLVRAPSGRPTVVEEVLEPTELGSVSPPRPVPIVWDDWSGGIGVSRPMHGVSGAYKVGKNACTRFGSVTPAGGLHEVSLEGLNVGQVHKMVAYKNDVIMATGDNRPMLIAGGLGPVRQAATLHPYSQIQDPAVFKGALYFTGGNGGLIKFDGATWTEDVGGPSLSRMAACTWTRAGVPRRRLVGTDPTGGNFLFTTGDDPFNLAHWSSLLPIESEYPIQQMVGTPRHVFAIGPGGVFDLTENGETPCVTGEAWQKNYNPSNGATGVAYDGMLYVASVFGTFAVDVSGRRVDVLEDVSIGHLQPAELPVGGQLSVLAQLDGWLLQCTWNEKAGGSQLWYGIRRERVGASVPWPMIWHGSECDLPNQRILALCPVAPNGGPRRLWIATRDLTDGRTRLWWHDLPRYGSPLQDWMFGQESDRMTYATVWSVTQTEEVAGDPASTKTPLWWDVLGRNLGSANTVSVSVTGRDGTTVQQGTATANEARFGATDIASKGLVVTAEGHNSERVPAVLDALKAAMVVTVEESITVMVEVMYGPGVALLTGAEDTQDADLTFSVLAHLPEHPSVQCTRWDGALMTARVEQGIRRRWIEAPDGDGWVEGAVLPLTFLGQQMRHDVGHRHDLAYRHDGRGT